MCNVYREACFSKKKKKSVLKGLHIGFPLQAWEEKVVHGVEIHFLIKKKVTLRVFSDMKRLDTSGGVMVCKLD